eukprot:TRINITY_DN8492_c0_g1_i1.p1 TRINITY_DN8492_c0_g1~~TRINITY_DN8492_c0_g1_i1.p1  ORF type:complete len:346 (-),score=140.57 TRINITY_DN8492_c0_g1_i1:247-1284(-)
MAPKAAPAMKRPAGALVKSVVKAMKAAGKAKAKAARAKKASPAQADGDDLGVASTPVQAAPAEPAYKFTPAKINRALCLARTWAEGAGGQCSRCPTFGQPFCPMHERDDRWKAHGRVDGPVPELKLREFERAAVKALTPEKKGKRARALKAEEEEEQDPVKKELLAKKPKKPVAGAWGVFVDENRDEFSKECVGKPACEVTKLASTHWKALGEEEKQKFQKKSEEKMAAYKKAYDDWQLEAIEKGFLGIDAKTPKKKQRLDGTSPEKLGASKAALPFSNEIDEKLLNTASEEALREASGLGYEKAFRMLRCRAGIVDKKLPDEKLVRALRASGGNAKKAYAALMN